MSSSLTTKYTQQGISFRFGIHFGQQAQPARRKLPPEHLDSVHGQVLKLTANQQRLVFLDALK